MRLGAYEILAPLGVGGMGEVYSARDRRLERIVALKLVLEAFVTDDEHTARFEHEARTLASLNHPNIATLHGLEEADGRHFLVMEFVEGETLGERIAARADGLPVEEALPIARQIAEALEAAHEKGIVHRDLKPANVKVPGRAYLGHVDREERFAIVAAVPPGQTSNNDIFRVPIASPGAPQPLIATAALEYAPAVSPDGRWLAYVTTASGGADVWVREMSGSGQWQISTSGGIEPRWSPDGRELFFRRDTRQMSVSIETTPHFRAGQERPLFDGTFNWRTESGMNYTVDPATGRFLMILPPSSGDGSAQPSVRVIANWEPALPGALRR
jgi:hypothetical protein